MKLNRLERWFVNSPVRHIKQNLVMQWFRGTVALKTGSTILEVGCGRGVGANLIRKVYQPTRLYLLDLDLQMILKASRRIHGHNGCRISLCVGDATRLPYADQSLDAVFGFGFLHHVPAWRDGLAEVNRVLKHGGVYFMEEYYPSLYQNFITKHLLVHPQKDRFNSQDLRRAFQDVNLTLTHSFELKSMGILGVGVKADSQSISCARHEDACKVVLD
ncbi:MAG: class I SAM-dependent methyltransferase [Desulfobacterales bacterium]|nr:class I SAM-dependent methyltransferase [Desulfobacterales bacterium]